MTKVDAQLVNARSYPELQSMEHPVYNFGDIFDDSSFFRKKLSRHKFLLLKNLFFILEKFREEDEKIHYVSFGMLNKIAEQLIGGLAMIYLNRFAFIFTSRRIIFIQLKGKFKIGRIKSMLEYASIKKTRNHLLGSLSIILNSGKRMNFVGMPRGDRKFIHKTIERISGIIPEEKKNTKGLLNLCPVCGIQLEGFPNKCRECKASFKSPLKAALLSLIFPGLGDIYLGHRGFGLMEFLGGMFVWFVIVLPMLASSGSGLESFLILLSTLVLVHVTDALFTAYVARKGIYPTSVLIGKSKADV